MIDRQSDDEIRTRPCTECYVCGSRGKMLYQGMKDRIFGAPGEWNLKKCLNPECGLMWLDPMPIEEDIGKAYQDYYTHQDIPDLHNTWLLNVYRLVQEGYLAHKYGYHIESVATWKRLLGMLIYLHPGRRADFDFTVMYLPAQPGNRLLEVGCGSGKKLKLMQDLGWYVEGVDFDQAAVDNAKSKGLKVHPGTVEEQKYPENYFDAIIMSHVIEHVHDPLSLLQVCSRILKPGGRLIIVTPNGQSLGHSLYRDCHMHLDPPRHLQIFTLTSLIRITKKAGFKIIRAWTTMRDAGQFMGSRSIQRVGKLIINGPQSRAVRIWARSMQLVEWGLLKIIPSVGEEIVLVVEK